MLLEVNTFENVFRFICVVFLFVVVLAMTYFTTRYIANFQKSRLTGGNIKILETFQIAPNKFLQLISVGKRYFVIAVSKDNITFLSEVKEDDIDLGLMDAMAAPSFKDIINKAKKKLEKTDNNDNFDENLKDDINAKED